MVTADEIRSLVARGVVTVHIAAGDWTTLEEGYRHGAGFTRAFPTFLVQGTKRGALVLFHIDTDDAQALHIGFVRSIVKVSTFDYRVGFEIIGRIEPDSLGVLLSRVDAPALRGALSAFAVNRAELQRFSPRLGEAVIRSLAAIDSNEAPMRQVLSQLAWPRTFKTAEALQADAIKMALRAFGATHPEAVDLELGVGTTALVNVRLLEDAVIEHDARSLRGFELVSSDVTGRATFINRSGRLEVITANKRPLERLLGVDLIYYNEPHGSLVMVQYKMMESIVASAATRTAGRKQWFVRINRQFQAELARMRRFDTEVDQGTGPYRLNPGAFFIKMVKRDAPTSSAGVIISLAHLDHFLQSGSAIGRRGGLRIGYNELSGHYLRTEGFVELVRSGYIGTRGTTTVHLKALIDATLTSDRGVVAAIQSAFEPMS
jgi:hypothetical protein